MTQTLHFQIHDVSPYINWLYFFHAWGFPARFGNLVQRCSCGACQKAWIDSFMPSDRVKAEEALRLYDDACRLLNELDGRFQTHAKVALLPAHSEGDDIVVVTDDKEEARIPLLRQQQPGKDGICWCLSDFISPTHPADNECNLDITHTLGIFVATVDSQMEQQHKEDDYQHLLHQTLADRLAEATAERMHEIVRKKIWGYAPRECFFIQQLFAEKYQGRRPAIGYPSLPDQSMNFVLDNILHFGSVGVSLTETGAMMPHASTSGLLLAHPMACHFSVGMIGDDQRADYARRRGMGLEEVGRFL